MPDRVISVPQATQIATRIKNKFDNVNGRLQKQAADLNIETISLTRGGYIATSGSTTDFSVVANNSYYYAVVDCKSGDFFKISGQGATSARLWAFADDDGKILARADVGTTESNEFVKAPTGATKLIINSMSNTTSTKALDYIAGEIETLSENLSEIYPKAYVNHSLKNDMTSEGVFAGLQCFKDGVASDDNYGQENVRYLMQFGKYDKLHIAFDFKYTKAVPYVSDTERLGLFYVRSGQATIYEQFRKAASQKGLYQRNVYYGYRIGTGTATNVTNFIGAKFNSLSGQNAFWVRYTGTATTAYIKPMSGSLRLYDGDNHDITYAETDSVESLISKINGVTDFEAGFIATAGKTCGELMLYEGDTINLVYSVTLYGSESAVNDNPKVYIPYAYDDAWHTFEACIDEPNLKLYYAIDGITGIINLESGNLTSGLRNVQIGGVFNGSESPIKIKDLQIDLENFGDAEIIRNSVWNYSTSTQLISERSPKVLIFEGHGIDVCVESDAPLSDDMAASTDRLHILFDTLKSKGYQNISYTDLIAWKINGKKIQKRSFLVMMDDYRVDNYVDLAQRSPFVKANVTTGLAIISDRFAEDATWTFNSTTYTREECFNMILRGGWYPCSHTRNHRRFTSILPSATEAQLSLDVISADKLGIYSDVMVYPYGEFDASYVPAMQASDFKIGINIAKNQYNCKAINDFYLSRVELGTRCPLDALLAQIV